MSKSLEKNNKFNNEFKIEFQNNTKYKINPLNESSDSIKVADWPERLNFSSLPPLSLYIHIPWCLQKCPYCDFNSHQTPDFIDEQKYINALEQDLIQTLPLVWGRPIHSVFIGGGTPSLFSAAGIESILAMVRRLLPMNFCQEITLEANPSTFEAEKFKEYAAAGVNRLSIGVQSFNDRFLKSLGRVHDGKEAMHAIEIAQRYFSRINLDLMYALPNQSLEDLADDVQKAVAAGTEHLSYYHLTMEPNTLFAKYPPAHLPDHDTAFGMQDFILEQLKNNGFERYEISAFSKNKQAQSLHNLNYWQFGDYIGIGAGAHGKITRHDGVLRTQKYKQPQQYMNQYINQYMNVLENAVPIDASSASFASSASTSSFYNKFSILEREITAQELPFEFILNALRLINGVDFDLFETHTALKITHIQAMLQKAYDKKLLQPIDFYLQKNIKARLQATPLGLDFLNELQEIFLI